MNESTLTKLNNYLRKQKVYGYKIQGHPLEKYQGSSKKIYIKLLEWIVKENPQIEEEQVLFFKHLKSSLDQSSKEEDYLSQVNFEKTEDEENQAFVETVGELFLKNFKYSDLRYNFIMDLLLILMRASEEQIETIILLCEVLELSKIEVEFLIELAECILEENSIGYMHLIERAPGTIHVGLFRCYVEPFHTGRLVDEDTYLEYYAKSIYAENEKANFNVVFKGEEMSLPRWTFKQDVVIFENFKIDLSNHKWAFRNNQKVIFKNCEIIGDNEPISFDGVEEIYLEKCIVTEFNNRVFLINDCIKVHIKQCVFNECIYLYDLYQNSNGCIYFIGDKGITTSTKEREVLIEETHFTDCSVWNKEEHYYSDYSLGFSEGMIQTIVNCTFKNCLSYMGTPRRLCEGGSCLFNNPIVIDCTVIASNPIKY